MLHQREWILLFRHKIFEVLLGFCILGIVEQEVLVLILRLYFSHVDVHIWGVAIDRFLLIFVQE